MTEQLPEHAPAAIVAWVQADRRLDLHTMTAQLSDDAVLVSPLTDQFRFEGPAEIEAVFASAFDALKDIVVERVTGSGNDWVLHGTNTLRGENLEEIQWLQLDEAGKISHITLFIRPAPAVLAMLHAIGPRLAKRGVLPRRAATSSAALRPIVAMLRLIEKRLMPKLGPVRNKR